ncbi:chloride channel protein [Paramuribaculum intestinale]|uniref:chloride channel protein n=1 Tax=Paramuribaculum intestinale TaxID=2094151 RepID=UPI0025A95800|nr:chloride channel protein [Paramuribaculum intestinale]
MISHTPPGFVRWVKARISPTPLIFILAFITGLGAGACAYALKEMIRHISKWLTAGLDSSWPDWMLVALPVAGIVLTGIFVRYILRHDITHGVSRIIGRLRNKDYTMRTSSIWSPMIASTITLGFGGSAGAEGPIAYVGAGIGSNLARWMQLTPDQMKILLGCGAAAGIAGIFKSPVGGFLFTLEVLRMELVTISVMGVLTATITAATTAYMLSGFTPDIAFAPASSFDPAMTGWFLALGVFIGLYALYYSSMMTVMQRLYNSISNPWLRNLSGGLILAVALMMFPALYGEGYTVITSLLAGDASPLLKGSVLQSGGMPMALTAAAALIVAIKTFATSASNSAGGVAGDFAPTLFAGAVGGLLFASLVRIVTGVELPAEQMVYAGMAGMMAGAVRAPIMALFLTVEMTGRYEFFFPLLAATAVSFGIVRLRNLRSFIIA